MGDHNINRLNVNKALFLFPYHNNFHHPLSLNSTFFLHLVGLLDYRKTLLLDLIALLLLLGISESLYFHLAQQYQLSSAIPIMASFQATGLIMLFASSVFLVNAIENVFQAHNDIFLRGFPGNISTNVTLLSAPYYRNVSAGAAWVVPRSVYDLGARGMTCECFDPNGRSII